MRRLTLVVSLYMIVCFLGIGGSAAAAATCDQVAAPGGAITTPQQLVDRLAPGQVGCFHAGTYASTDVEVTKANVTLQSYPGEQATWNGRIVIAAPSVTVQNLNLDGSTGDLLDGPPKTSQCAALPLGNCTKPSVSIEAPNAKIYSNEITNHTGICIHTLSYGGLTPDRFDIERNRIHDCKPADQYIHGIYISDAVDGVIKYNVVYNNGDRGIQLYPSATHVMVSYNTVDGNRTNMEFGGDCFGSPPVCTSPSDNTVIDNIFSFPSTSSTVLSARFNVEAYQGGGAPAGVNNMVSGNCTSTNLPSYYLGEMPRGSGITASPNFTAKDEPGNPLNIVGNPHYVNRSAHDFTLASGSPCAGKGAPSSVTAPTPVGIGAQRGQKNRLARRSRGGHQSTGSQRRWHSRATPHRRGRQ